jgi:PTS system nitrogen regulatory IIA component
MMKIIDYLKEDGVISDLQGIEKLSVLKELSRVVVKPYQSPLAEEITEAVLYREKLGSTGIGEGIAIPHGRLKRSKDFIVSFGRSIKGIDFDSIDHQPTHLFFLVMAPENSAVNNLKLLGRIVTILKNASFKKRLMEARSHRELFQLIAEEDEKY